MISHNPGTASHVSNLSVIIALFVVRQVKRCIDKAEVREQSLCGYFNCQTEQIIIRIFRIIVDSFFNLENLYRENGGLSISKSDIGNLQKILHGHSCFRRSTGSVVNGTERHLGACSGIHGI